MIGFVVQGIVFYAMALVNQNIVLMQWALIILCVVDTVWLGMLKIIYKISDKVKNQWLLHNIIVAGILTINVLNIIPSIQNSEYM